MKPTKTRLSITIDSNLLHILKRQAELDSRPLSQYINLVLTRAMESEMLKYQKTE